jgi:hypothetical protein
MVQQKLTVTFDWLTLQQCGVNVRGRIAFILAQHPQPEAILNCNEVSEPQRRGSQATPTRAATQAGRHLETVDQASINTLNFNAPSSLTPLSCR